MGDKTQIATVALAAQFHSIVWVVLGTTIGMMLAERAGGVSRRCVDQARADEMGARRRGARRSPRSASTSLWFHRATSRRIEHSVRVGRSARRRALG